MGHHFHHRHSVFHPQQPGPIYRLPGDAVGPPGAARPQLTADIVGRLQPHAQAIADRVGAGETFAVVAQDIAQKTHTTPGQVLRYVQALMAASKQPPA